MAPCSKAATLLPQSVFSYLLWREPLQASQMQMLFFVWLLLLLYATCINRVASRPLRLNPVPADVLEGAQPGIRLRYRVAGHQVLAGSIRRVSAPVPPGMAAAPELTSLCIKWCQWEWCLNKLSLLILCLELYPRQNGLPSVTKPDPSGWQVFVLMILL